VPWSYYESARSRRIIHQYSNKSFASKRKEFVEEELRRHELIGLIWVVMSPAIAGYTLQYSRYFLSNYDKYMSTFNVTVFVLAATLKPLIHVMALLRERTLFLQSEMQIDETQMETLQKKLELMQEELEGLRKAYATKRDLGQVKKKKKSEIILIFVKRWRKELPLVFSNSQKPSNGLRRKNLHYVRGPRTDSLTSIIKYRDLINLFATLLSKTNINPHKGYLLR
jgi:hypothetical protein